MKKNNFFSRKTAGLGLDLGSEWLKMVKIRGGKGGCVLESVSRLPWQPGDLDNTLATSKKINSLWSQYQLKDQVVVSSLAGHAVIVKRVNFDAESEKALGDVVLKEARQYIPFDINDVFLDYQVMGPGTKEKSFDVLLVASKKKVVQNLSEVLSQSGLSLSVIDVDSFALCNSFEYNYPEESEKPVYLLDIGGAQSVFCIYHSGQPVFLREVSFGGRAVTESVASVLNIKRMEAERIKVNGANGLEEAQIATVGEAVGKILVSWCDELKRLIGFYQTSTKNAVPAEKMFVSGGGALIKGLPELFQRELSISVLHHDPFKKVKFDDGIFQKDYIKEISAQLVVPFGLALRAI